MNTPTPYQIIQRKIRRAAQKGGWSKIFNSQAKQVRLLQKLYAKNGFDLAPTSSACPEQYDVLRGSEPVAYLRLRHGFFTVECPYSMDEVVFSGQPAGDGAFDDIERIPYMVKALRAIQNYWSNK